MKIELNDIESNHIYAVLEMMIDSPGFKFWDGEMARTIIKIRYQIEKNLTKVDIIAV